MTKFEKKREDAIRQIEEIIFAHLGHCDSAERLIDEIVEEHDGYEEEFDGNKAIARARRCVDVEQIIVNALGFYGSISSRLLH